VLTPRNETNGKYWHYLLKSHNFIEEYYRNGRGIVADLWTTRLTDMKTIYLPLPPRDEQDQIVRYLDWKVSRIDKYIKLIHGKSSIDPKILEDYPKSLLSLLSEYRTRLISDVVTGKLDVRDVVIPTSAAVESDC
jgi:restriction endonuclease S subunit